MNSTIALDLTNSELYWLAAAFGFEHLPLALPYVSAEGLQDAKESLQKRGLMRPGNRVGWEMDAIAALSLQWMGNADKFWVFDQYKRDGTVLETLMILQDGAALMVFPLPGGKRIMVCRDMDIAIETWQISLGSTVLSKEVSKVEWDVPQPITIIRSVWTRPELARTISNHDFLDWAAQLDWAGEWAVVHGEHRFSRMAVARMKDSIWAGSFTPGSPGEFRLSGYSQLDLSEELKNMTKY